MKEKLQGSEQNAVGGSVQRLVRHHKSICAQVDVWFGTPVGRRWLLEFRKLCLHAQKLSINCRLFFFQSLYRCRQIALRFRLFNNRRKVIAELRRSRRRGVIDNHAVQYFQLLEDFHKRVIMPNDPS